LLGDWLRRRKGGALLPEAMARTAWNLIIDHKQI